MHLIKIARTRVTRCLFRVWVALAPLYCCPVWAVTPQYKLGQGQKDADIVYKSDCTAPHGINLGKLGSKAIRTYTRGELLLVLHLLKCVKHATTC